MSEQHGFWRRLYHGWLEIAALFGEVQTLMVLTMVYTLVLGPVSLVLFSARKDLLHKGGLGGSESTWSKADSAGADLERAKRLF